MFNTLTVQPAEPFAGSLSRRCIDSRAGFGVDLRAGPPTKLGGKVFFSVCHMFPAGNRYSVVVKTHTHTHGLRSFTFLASLPTFLRCGGRCRCTGRQ